MNRRGVTRRFCLAILAELPDTLAPTRPVLALAATILTGVIA